MGREVIETTRVYYACVVYDDGKMRYTKGALHNVSRAMGDIPTCTTCIVYGVLMYREMCKYIA